MTVTRTLRCPVTPDGKHSVGPSHPRTYQPYLRMPFGDGTWTSPTGDRIGTCCVYCGQPSAATQRLWNARVRGREARAAGEPAEACPYNPWKTGEWVGWVKAYEVAWRKGWTEGA